MDQKQEEIDELRAKVKKLEAALLVADRQTSVSRIWGGMGWKYLPMIPMRVKKIADAIAEARSV
jgi:hypothetical protein